MKRGLVIGKFMPVHEGHVALIRCAAERCDELVVSMSFSATDPISGSTRFEWLRSIFRSDPKVALYNLVDDFDDDSLPWPERTRVWALELKRRYGTIDVVFSSEDYGHFLAEHLQAENVLFDQSRSQFPVSASQIRQRPFHSWDYIPSVVRPYFVKKICFFGPESTGKSTMARQLAAEYQTDWVPEVAREFVTTNDFSEDDIVRIGHEQTNRMIEKTKTANKILFCDTDLITTQIYSEKYLHVVPPVLHELEKQIHYDLYFLFDIDVAWVPDGLRDLGHQRPEMYRVFKEALESRNIPYINVSGTYAERTSLVKRVIDKLLAD